MKPPARRCSSPRRNGTPCRAWRAKGSVFCPFHSFGREREGANWLVWEEAFGCPVVFLAANPDAGTVPPAGIESGRPS
jgi:hypothetical protein